MERYQIPSGRATAELEVSKSRFIGAADRADTVADARAFVRSVRAEHPKANHHVYAFVIGFGPSVTEGCGDDGEPSGTAGRPALAVLRGSGLGDTVLVVTRYFGGTKLGTGGLVHAYSETARLVLDALARAEKVQKVRLKVQVPYASYDSLQRLVDSLDGERLSEEFAASVTLEVQFLPELVPAFTSAVRDLTSGRAAITFQ